MKYNLLHMIQVPSTSLWTDSLGLRIKTVLMREQTLKCGWTRKPQLRKTYLGFPDGSEVKNPPANAGDMVRSLVLEDPTCLGATKPVYHSYWACALEPRSHNFWSLCGLEPMFCNKRSHCTATTLAATTEKPVQHWRPRAAKNKSINKKNRLCTQSHVMLSKFFFLSRIFFSHWYNRWDNYPTRDCADQVGTLGNF